MFTVSWNSAFALEKINLPILFSFCYVFFSIQKIYSKINIKVVKFVLIPFFFTSTYYIFSSLINPHPKILNYNIAYIFLPLLCCYLPQAFVVRSQYYKKIQIAFISGLVFVAIICIFESIIRYYYGFDITSLVPQFKENFVRSLTISGKALNRSRAFSSEPLVVGISLSIGLQYSLIKLKNLIIKNEEFLNFKVLKYFIFAFLFIFAILATGAASSFFICLLGITCIISELLLYTFLDFRKGRINKFFVYFFIIFISILSSLILLLYLIPAYQTAIENILGKIFLDTDYASVSARIKIISQYFQDIIYDPFGIKGSVGSLSRNSSAINWYLTLLGDVGIIGTIFTLIPIFTSALISINSPISLGFSKFDKLMIILIPIFGLLFHGTFQSSPLWATIIVAYYL